MTEKECTELADLLYPNVKDVSYYFEKYKDRNVLGEVTRLGPSPTGYLHIGHLMQALIHRMLANVTDGIFYLRLEDTDGKREIKNAGEVAYDMLVRFGLTPDEGYRGSLEEVGDYGPYVQSKRLDIYHAFAHELVRLGRAFPCFCASTAGKEEIIKKREKELNESMDLEVKDPCRDLTLDEIKDKLKQGKPFALRLKSTGDKEKTHEFKDEIMGKRDLRENARDDILIKSNGIPVYAFAHIVDDNLMKTTVIVRGQDWYQSLPVHIELNRAFGFKPFRYAHTPNICILDENTGNKRKLSKRKDAFADVRFFLEKGYPIVAVIEYLLTLLNSDFEMWRKNNPTFSYTEFPFSLKKIGVSSPLFDFMKLNDISKTIISKMTAEEVYDETVKWVNEWDKEKVDILSSNRQRLLQVFSIDRGGDRPRKDITYFSEVLDLYKYVLPNFEPVFNIGEVENKDELIAFLKDYGAQYIEQDNNQDWFNNLKEVGNKHNFVDNKLFKHNPTMYAGNVATASKFVRIAITGSENSPELFSIMKILGAEECKSRINKLIQYLQKI